MTPLKVNPDGLVVHIKTNFLMKCEVVEQFEKNLGKKCQQIRCQILSFLRLLLEKTKGI